MSSARHLPPAALHVAHAHALSVLDSAARTVRCDHCSRTWVVAIEADGQLPPRWWACPNGCNS